MNRNLTLSLLATLALSAAPLRADFDAAWTVTTDADRPGRIQLGISRDVHQHSSNTMPLAAFSGLTTSQIHAAATTPVRFTLAREAGTATFEGTFRNGKGAGQMTFTGNRAYVETLRSMGVAFDLPVDRRRKATEEDEKLFVLAFHDVSTSFIRSMQSEGFRVSLEKYLALRIFDVTPAYIQEMRTLGFKELDDDELIATRIHNVTPAYVREMRAAGWNLSLDELQASRIHGATPEYAGEMRKLGYELDFDDLVAFRIHEVTPQFIAELAKAGYRNVDADDLVAMRIHEVTPAFIAELKAAGYSNVPVEKLVAMRIHGVDAKFIARMDDE
jgi:hypothetical protein